VEEGGKEVGRVAFPLHLGPLSNFCIIRPLLQTLHVFGIVACLKGEVDEAQPSFGVTRLFSAFTI